MLLLKFTQSCKYEILIDVIEIRLCLLSASVGIPCQIAMGFTTNFMVYMIAYCMAFGFVGGVAYMVPVHHTWGWFPSRAALMSGFIIGAVGLGPIIFD